MKSAVRRLLAGCLLAGAALTLGGPASAAAPSGPAECARVTAAEATENAQAVFTGVVAAVDRDAGSAQDPLFLTTVDVDIVYKGAVKTASVSVVTRPTDKRSTGLGALKVGKRYLFFVRVLETDTPAYVAGGCGGTGIATAQHVTRVEELLGEGRPPVPPEQPPVEFSSADDSDAASFTRAAAPGLALVLVGLLGLVVVGRLGRRA